MDTHFRSSCGSHIVHMQKIWNRSHFFQKIFPHRVYFQNFRNRSGLPQKKLPDSTYAESLQPFTLFAKNLPHRVYFQNFWKRSHFSELFSKNLSMASSGRPDITISPIFYTSIRQIRQNYPLPGLFPKSPSTVPFLSNFFKKFYLFTTAIAKTPRKGHTLSELFSKKALHSTEVISQTTPRCVAAFGKNSPKNIISHHWLSQFPPCFVTPFFNFFSKIFVSPLLTITFLPPKGHTCSKNFSKKPPHYWLLHFFCVLFLHSWKKLKIFPSGNKSW